MSIYSGAICVYIVLWLYIFSGVLAYIWWHGVYLVCLGVYLVWLIFCVALIFST